MTATEENSKRAAFEIEQEIIMILWTLVWVAAVILDLFALSDVMNSSRDTFSKIVLMALIILFPVFAAGLYLLVFREKGYSL